MYIIYHSSDSFAEVTGVSIASLFENNKDMEEIHVLYIEKGMTEENKNKILAISNQYNRSLKFIEMPDWQKKLNLQLKSSKRSWLGLGYNRLFLTEYLPAKIEKVLYLDSDTVVEQSLKELWNIDLDGYYMAGVDDCLSRFYRSLVGISGDEVYCNAGMLLFNVKKWREDNIQQRFIDLIVENQGTFVFNDQTILNMVFSGHTLILPQKYNVNSLVYLFDYDELMKLRRPYHFSYDQEELENSKNSPVITHYTGNFFVRYRPWEQNSDHPHKDVYLKYRKFTPWASVPLTQRKKVSILKNLCHWIPRKIMLFSVSFLYNILRPIAIRIKINEGKK